MRAARLLQWTLWPVYGFFWAGGVGSHVLSGGSPPGMQWTAPLFLFLAAAIVAASTPGDWRGLAIGFGIGFAAEVIGVVTGDPFGRYFYTPVLAPSLFGVPVAIAGAWMVLLAWVRQLGFPFWAGALLMTAFDLVIDPLAANTLAYWRWPAGGFYYGVPGSNFAGWFAISVLMLVLSRTPPPRNLSVIAIGSSILVFFAILSARYGFFVPSALGFLLAGGGYWRWRSSMVSTRI